MKNTYGKTIKTPFGEVYFSRIVQSTISILPLYLFLPASMMVLLDIKSWAGIVSSIFMTLSSYLIVKFYQKDSYSRLFRWKVESFDVATKIYIYFFAIGFQLLVYSRAHYALVVFSFTSIFYIIYIGYNNYKLNKELFSQEVDFSEFKGKPAPMGDFDYKFFVLLSVSIWAIAGYFNFKPMPVHKKPKSIQGQYLPLSKIKAIPSASVHSTEGLDTMVELCSQGEAYPCAVSGGIYLMSKDTSLYAKAFSMLDYSCVKGSLEGCSNLAAMYALGLGQPQDLLKAKEIYTYACSKGFQEACNNIVNVNRGIEGNKDDLTPQRE